MRSLKCPPIPLEPDASVQTVNDLRCNWIIKIRDQIQRKAIHQVMSFRACLVTRTYRKGFLEREDEFAHDNMENR